MPEPERAELFVETAERKGLPEAIIEKDFWVCWVLKQLFSAEELSGRVLFKGGTSLSKIFHAINRFSEEANGEMDQGAERQSGREKNPTPTPHSVRAFFFGGHYSLHPPVVNS
jgi:hypothetical protein